MRNDGLGQLGVMGHLCLDGLIEFILWTQNKWINLRFSISVNFLEESRWVEMRPTGQPIEAGNTGSST